MTFYRNPTTEQFQSKAFDAIWQEIKRWDVNTPEYEGYCGATGNHVAAILNALKDAGFDLVSSTYTEPGEMTHPTIPDEVVREALEAFDAEEERHQYPSTKECLRAALAVAVRWAGEESAKIADDGEAFSYRGGYRPAKSPGEIAAAIRASLKGEV